MAYLLRRLLHALGLLIGVSVLTFVFSELAPGDYASQIQLDPRMSAEAAARLSERHGLDQPLPVRYWEWLKSVFRGELGWSYSRNAPVGPMLWPRMWNTLLLTSSALLLSWLIALPLGIFSAARRGGIVDRAASTGSALLLSMPELLLGLGALFVAARSGLFPTGGIASVGAEDLGFWARLADRLHHLALPLAALTLAGVPVLVRHVRAALVDVLGQPFLRLAASRGVPRRRVLYRHALRAAANPLVTLFGLSLAGLTSGSLLIEIIMSWPGIGPLLLQAIGERDVHVVIAAVLLSCVFLIGGNLVADLLLAWVDPRVRERS